MHQQRAHACDTSVVALMLMLVSRSPWLIMFIVSLELIQLVPWQASVCTAASSQAAGKTDTSCGGVHECACSCTHVHMLISSLTCANM